MPTVTQVWILKNQEEDMHKNAYIISGNINLSYIVVIPINWLIVFYWR